MTGIHLIFHLLEHEGMVAHFVHLHARIAKTSNASLAALAIRDRNLAIFHQLLV